jgi:hypothetical protein
VTHDRAREPQPSSNARHDLGRQRGAHLAAPPRSKRLNAGFREPSSVLELVACAGPPSPVASPPWDAAGLQLAAHERLEEESAENVGCIASTMPLASRPSRCLYVTKKTASSLFA